MVFLKGHGEAGGFVGVCRGNAERVRGVGEGGVL